MCYHVTFIYLLEILYALYFLFLGVCYVLSVSSHFVLYLYCNKLMCVHMSRMSFERLFSVSLFSFSFSLRDACPCMCVVALVQIKLYMCRICVIMVWMHFYLPHRRHLLLLLFSFGNSNALNTDRIYWLRECDRVTVSIDIIY